MERIAILCSGGDCQGMNTCIKAFVNTCTARGITPIGVVKGYQGLIDDSFIFLTNEMVENIDGIGGTILKVSRSEEFRTPIGLDKAVRNLNKNKIDGLVIIGGNGSFNGAVNLVLKGINVVAIPGTIDNDLFYSEKSLGFDTAVNNSVKAIDDIMQSVSSNDRGFVIEVMGRNCGDIALHTAIGVGAHSLACAELNSTLKDIVADIKHCMKNGVTSPIVVISENCDFSIKDVEKALNNNLKIETRSTALGYIQRGGSPSICDRMLAIRFAITAVKSLQEGKVGIALGLKNNEVEIFDLIEAVKVEQDFDRELYRQLRELHNI